MADHAVSGEEMVDIIMEHIEEDGRLAADEIIVDWHAGKVILSGRVSSDDHLEIIDEILADIPELGEYENNIWVDDTLAFEDAEDEEGEDEDEDDISLEEGDDLDADEPLDEDE